MVGLLGPCVAMSILGQPLSTIELFITLLECGADDHACRELNHIASRSAWGCSATFSDPPPRVGNDSKVSPVVTKRQSAMTSLRASATIMVLRVPLRLSVVRSGPRLQMCWLWPRE